MSKRQVSRFIVKFFVFVLLVSSVEAIPSGSATPHAGMPIFITTAGQSADAYAVKLLLDRSKMKSGYDAIAEANKIIGSKTLILVMGGSSKGLGAAGMDEDEEIARINHLLDGARKEKMYIVGLHIGGESRRGALSAKFINLVAPFCNYLIVKKDGNKDGYFTDLGTKKKIPVTLIDETLDLVTIFKSLFSVN